MNVFKIAWRSIQHRGLGSVLTIFSMALGVMLVVAVLTVHGVVSRSFNSVSTFSFDNIVATSGSGMQVTMNTVFYLSSPVENIPYEFYLAFCDARRREDQFQYSVAMQSRLMREQSEMLADRLSGAASPAAPWLSLASQSQRSGEHAIDDERIGLKRPGKTEYLAEMAVPVNLGDYLDVFRVVGTTPDFFSEIFLDAETRQPLTFAEGRAFVEFSEEHGYFEAVLGSVVARELNLRVGDVINPIHGDPDAPGAHTHEQGFTVVGVLDATGLPHDRAAFCNMEGFFLMEDHAADPESANMIDPVAPLPEDVQGVRGDSGDHPDPATLRRVRLPIEHREVTAVLVRSPPPAEDEEFMDIGSSMSLSAINEGTLKDQLKWSDFRPLRSKDQAQAVSPVREVTLLFDSFVNPLRWILLLLTVMICIVSGISILVGIYNSMAQRKHEIAVMRALGANRSRVMLITLLESVTLAMLGGIFGWVAGHGLNAIASPFVEDRTGVSIGFLDFAPPVPVFSYLAAAGIPISGADQLEWLQVSPELFLIPGLILLAVLVGLYPAISAYRTDVAESLGS
jgi:putative ABC transport system permease protein